MTVTSTLVSLFSPLQRYQGQTIVVKYGGNAMTDPALQRSFAQDIVQLQLMGLKPVVVHGGGPQINQALGLIQKEGIFIQGMRVTDEQTMQVVQWVLAGQVQKEIVMGINQAGGRAVGLTGKDGLLIQAQKQGIPDAQDPSKTIDLGLVGKITHIDTRIVCDLQQAGYIPVISPIGFYQDQTYNINADTVASDMAKALKASQLLLMSNIPGVLDKNGELIARLDSQAIQTAIQDGTISGGMIPKIKGALEAAEHGIDAVHIIDGRVPHCLLLKLFSDQGVGTTICV